MATFKEKMDVIDKVIDKKFESEKSQIIEQFEDWNYGTFDGWCLEDSAKMISKLDIARAEIDANYDNQIPLSSIKNIEEVIDKHLSCFYFVKDFSEDELAIIGEIYNELYNEKFHIPTEDELPF